MPNLKPTRATALVYDNGHVCALSPGRSAGASFTAHDCLILPAPVPIKECPEEWKDGRWYLLNVRTPLLRRWIDARWDAAMDSWMGSSGGEIYECDVTHIMLPPPDPCAEEVKP